MRNFSRKEEKNHIIGIVDSSSTEVVTYTYDAWGELLSVSGTLACTVGEANHLRYRGYYYDTESGMYYLQSRYYDPELGRFISKDDPIYHEGETDTIDNLYNYCRNNPVKFVDPSGHKTIECSITKTKMIRTCKISITINYIESTYKRKDTALLKSIKLVIKLGTQGHVSKYTVSYGSYGLLIDGKKKPQSKSQTYKAKGGNKYYINETRSINCPNTWKPIFAEDKTAVLGASLVLTIVQRNRRNSVSSYTEWFENNVTF